MSLDAVSVVIRKVQADYLKNATIKTQMVDAFLCYTVATGLIQFLYVVLVGTFPFNSFLSSLFCHVGLFALGVSLRLQLTSSTEFKGVTQEKSFGDFIFCSLVLFFVVFSFMG